ncbi:hypothetical protein [Gimesia chilikensis]|uniref:Uncharacterized protein n=1 Tax=Gimesia chilikensis TaxID=2605989 RepID=A0A517PRB1_9PLAN|nr:hypothetical protein [Gimesia chilikensis]QDT21914.1 hypothetical protein HG66A1_37190 [Gimesia chilikensis]
MKIDKELISVDFEKCSELSQYLLSVQIPLDREESTLPCLDPILIGNFYLLLVAICHQTSPLNKSPLKGIVDGKELKGWDYLFKKLEQEASRNPKLLLVDSWVSFSPEYLQSLYHDDQFGNSLSDPIGRTALINNLGSVMLAQGWNSLEDIYLECGRQVAEGYPNLLGQLTLFEAFRDPVKKKSFFLLSLMRNNGLWNYRDEENLGPPVDYHEVRGHLRIGTVKILDLSLHLKIMSQEQVSEREDIFIRQAVVDAIMLISKQTGMTPSQLHYLFWNIFRSCCTRETPHCHKCPPEPHLPERYQHLADQGSETQCPFSKHCDSADNTQKYIEHIFVTDFY